MTPRIWSLHDLMRVFKLREIGMSVYLLKDDYDLCRQKRDRNSQAIAVDVLAFDPKRFYQRVLKHLTRASTLCAQANLGDAANHIHDINLHYALTSDAIDFSSLCADLRNAIDVMMRDLRDRIFLNVDPTFSKFVDNDLLFGQRVFERFPSAVPDIREAGNSLAAEGPTAAVFHLMRVAEYGLRALAYDRRVKLDKKKPIDLATWEDVLKKLEDAEDDIRNFPKTQAREAQFDFVHGAMMELKRFKNKFRNRTMHNRDPYDMGQARNAFEHVKAFMEILASRISEGKRTPRIWKGTKWLEEQ